MEPALGRGKLEISDVLKIYFLLPFGSLTTPTEENIDRDHRKSRKGVPSQLQFPSYSHSYKKIMKQKQDTRRT